MLKVLNTEMISNTYRGVAYSAKGRFSPQGRYFGEYRIGTQKEDEWVRCEALFATGPEALADARGAARAAIDQSLA